MTQENPKKVLRVGVIYNGKILDEQIFRKPETVFIGDSERSHFVVPSSSLPSKIPIFYFKSGRYELVVMKNMTGKVFLKGKVIEIEEVVKKGMLKKRGNAYILPLSLDSRGKVMVGSAIVLFQFITPPPKPPKLRLPKSIRGSWTQRLDWPFISILSVCLIGGFLFFGIYLPGIPAPEVDLARIPNRFAQLIVPKMEDLESLREREDTVSMEDTGTQVSTAKKEEEKARKEPKRSDKPRDAATIQKEESIRRAEMQARVAGKGLLRIIGSVGESGEGGIISDVLGDGAKDRDIDTALAGIKQIGVATSSTQRSRKGDIDATETARLEGLDVKKSDGEIGVAARKERAIIAKTTIEAPEIDGAVDSSSISQVVRRNQAAIRRCYERELNANPDLRGKVAVTIIINEQGRIQMADISEDTVGSPAVSKCIVGVVNRWRFPRPEGGPASVTIPFVFSSSN